MAYTDYNVNMTTATTTTGLYWWNYPPATWVPSTHTQKCQNCGYCSCCGKSDIPGKLTPETDG